MKKLRKVMNADNLLISVCFFLAIVILVISVLGGYMYSFCYKTVYSEFLSGNLQRLVTVKERHENDMQIMDDIIIQLGGSEDITRFQLGKEPAKGKKLIDRLKQYTEISQFFDVLLYQYHKDEYIFNAYTSVSTDFFVEKGCVLEETEAAEFKKLLLSKRQELYILPQQRGSGNWIGSYITDVDRIVFFQTIPPKYEETLVFIVPATYYDKLLGDLTEEEYGCFLYYNDRIITSRGDVEVSDEALKELLAGENISEISNNEVVQRTVVIDGEEYLLSIQKGNSQVCYGILQSMGVFHNKMKTEQWSIILLILICFVGAISVIIFYSGKLIKRVKSIGQLLEEDEYYNLSNVEEGIQALIVNYEESQRENLLQKRVTFVRNFVRGDYGSREDVINAANKAELRADYQRYVLVAVRNREVDNENKVFSAILEMLIGEEKVAGYGVRLINNNQNIFVLFGDTEEAMEEVLNKFLGMERKYCQDFIIAISDYHTDFTESAKAYLEADMAFDNYLLLDNNRIIRFSEIIYKEYGKLSVDNYVKQLRYALQTADTNVAERAVSGICSKLKHEKVSLYAFRIFYLDIIHILLKEWDDEKVHLERFYNVFTLSQCMNVQDFYDLLYDICKIIIDKKNGKELQEQDIVQEAITYMKKNFHDPNLTINVLVEYLGVSSVVLASEFRKAMDLRPSDYLGNLRMERAKELLRTTDMLVKEISLAVGYEDEHVLMRRFKEYTGMTPKQYRKAQ